MKRVISSEENAKRLIWFSVPLVLSGLFQQLFNWIDGFIVGNVNGELALAGIGAVSSLYHLFVTVITGFTVGISVLAGQKFGRGERKELNSLLLSCSAISGGCFLLLAALGTKLTRPVLQLMGTPDRILTIGEAYLKIVVFGLPFLAVYNVFAAVLRGMGDSSASFLAVSVCSVANIILDIAFVVGLKWGASGAAVATVISQGMMMIFVAVYAFTKYSYLSLRRKGDLPSYRELTMGLRFGFPPAVQSSVTSVGNLFLQRFMNGFGEQTVAAITTAYRVDSVIMLPIINLGAGIAALVAQQVGAGKEEEAKSILKTGGMMMAVISVCLTGVVYWLGEPMLQMFGLTQASAHIGGNFFRIIAGFYMVYGMAMAMRGYLEGHGDLVFSGGTTIMVLLVRIGASYLLENRLGNMAIAYAEALSWEILLLIYCIRMRSVSRTQGGIERSNC